MAIGILLASSVRELIIKNTNMFLDDLDSSMPGSQPADDGAGGEADDEMEGKDSTDDDDDAGSM